MPRIDKDIPMADFIEGKRPLIEALRTQVPLRYILMADNVQQDGQIKDIMRKARQFDVPIKKVPRKVLDEKSERGSHQGVVPVRQRDRHHRGRQQARRGK